MIPDFIAAFFETQQELLWLMTLLLMYRRFARTGLTAAIVLAILLANLQGPKLTAGARHGTLLARGLVGHGDRRRPERKFTRLRERGTMKPSWRHKK
jgi:hypothetical protein